MPSLVETLHDFSARWAVLIAAGLWQSTLLAAVVALVAWSLRGASPGVRYWLWQIVAIKLLVMLVWSWSVPLPWSEPMRAWTQAWFRPAAADTSAVAAVPKSTRVVRTDEPAAMESTAEISSAPVVRWRASRRPAQPPAVWRTISWTTWAFLAWSAIVLMQMVRLLTQHRRLSGLLARATPAQGDVLQAVSRVCHDLGLAEVPSVWQTDESCTPFVCGIRSAKLVLPREVLNSLDVRQLTPILAHELAHLKRRDLLWGWLCECARMLYFFHPVMYWVSYHVRLERELACDQMAMAASGQRPAEYAEILVRVLSAVSRPNVFRATATAGLDGGESLP